MSNLRKPQEPLREEPSLKGTLASVMILGAILIGTWVSVYILFISRN